MHNFGSINPKRNVNVCSLKYNILYQYKRSIADLLFVFFKLINQTLYCTLRLYLIIFIFIARLMA